MRLVIDSTETTTGWAEINGGIVAGVNTYVDYIAGNNSASILFELPSVGDAVEKLYTSIDVTDYEELRFSIFTRGYTQADFENQNSYILEFIVNGTDTFLVPLWGTFTTVNFDIRDITEITSLRFELNAIGDRPLEILVSEIQVVLDEFPIDILESMQDQLGTYANQLQTKFPVGTVSASIGDDSIVIEDNGNPINLSYLDRYMVIKFGDEIHGIEHKSPIAGGATRIKFTQYFDGSTVLDNYTDETVYIYTDVTIGRKDDHVISLPSITAWGFVPENYKISTDIEILTDSLKGDNTFRVRQVGEYFEYLILLDCESRSTEILGSVSDTVKKFIARKTLWVNGLKCLMLFEGIPVEIIPDVHYDIIPKIQYTLTIRVREEIWERTIVPKVSLTTLTVEIQ